MSPKRARQQNKTVTIYNSKTSNVSKKDKKINCYEQSRNSLENWEFHFKSADIEDVKSALKCKDLSGVPLIIGAVVLNQKEILIGLIKHGYNINESDKHNMSPIYWAVKLKHMEIILHLLTNNADLSIKPLNGDDILLLALSNSIWDEDSFVLLWHYVRKTGYADLNATNKNGLSMLHLSVRREWNIFVDILLTNDVNINTINPNGITPLMLACFRNDANIVSRLISKGASIKRRNCDGFTALCYAFSSAVSKHLEAPFAVVEKLQHELAKQNIYLQDYLRDRLKLLLYPAKKPSADQPNAQQIFQHIFTFVLTNIDEAPEILHKELKVCYILKEAMEKHIGNRKCVLFPLVVLQTIVKCLTAGDRDDGAPLIGDISKSGCFDACLAVLRKYEEDIDLVYAALSPIILSHSQIVEWIENNQQDLTKFYHKLAARTSPTNDDDYRLVRQKGENLFEILTRQHNNKGTDTNLDANVEGRAAKKNRRRSKALKAKIAKIKTADLTERLNVRKQSVKNGKEDVNENIVGIIVDEVQEETTDLAKDELHWKSAIKQLAFNNFPSLKSSGGENGKDMDVDLVIKYLENVLGIIVNKYKIIWDLDRPFEEDSDHEFGYSLSSCRNCEALQDIEKEKLRVVHREFYNLTRNIKQSYDNNPQVSETLLKELEKLLLTHSIRGETILDQVAAREMVKMKVSMPCDFQDLLPKYIENVLNDEIEENEEIQLQIVDDKNVMDRNSMGDYVYLKDCSDHDEDDYNVLPANFSHSFNSPTTTCDECDDVLTTCYSKESANEINIIDSSDSRWCSLLRSLDMMEDSQIFLAGQIRISNVEKRKSHVLSPSGNFAALEIGLGRDNLPLAVKFVPKNDGYAHLLKALIAPILKLRHRNVLRYHLCSYDLNYLIIATPLCEYNLGQYVLKMKHTQMKICKIDIIRQILAGIMYLHDQYQPIVHGNLKPSNVLIDVVGNVRVAEFGIHQALMKVKNLPESSIIWFATECYKCYKQNSAVVCTCASDIQVTGMLLHFAVNNGSHPFGKNVMDILKNLEKATPQIMSKDMEFHDLLTWMLLGEPSERPTIHQVLSHIFFWSEKKKWRYITACAGLVAKIPLNLEKLHASLDKIAAKENIVGNGWVVTAKKQYPQATFVDSNDTPSGLLKFINYVIENDAMQNENELSAFILSAFPYFSLSLYRMIEKTQWSDHRIFMPFHNVIDY